MAITRRKFTQCPNCGYTFEEVNNYCPNCGQENHDLNVPVKHLIAEFFEGTLHFDTKIWSTLKLLLLKPGVLTEKFNVGQRASYVPPFRLYVFVSLVFFFILALTSGESVKIAAAENGTTPNQAALPGITLNTGAADSAMLAAKAAQLKKLEKLTPGTGQQEKLKQEIKEDKYVASFAQKFSNFTTSGEQAKQKLFKNLSFMMFLLMPFFGLILHLFYRSQGRNYVEHLIFSIHLHTFYFILLIVAMLLGELFPALDLSYIILAFMALYLYLAMRRVYKQTYLKALLSMLPISFVYLVTLLIFIVGTVGVSVLMS